MRTAVLFALVAAVFLLTLPAAGPRAEDDADLSFCRNGKDLNRAYDACSRVLAAPDIDRARRARTLWNRATILTDLGNRRAAIADYTAIFNDYPGDQRIWNERGRLYRSLGDYDQAIDDFTKAIELQPEKAIYHSNRGLSYKLKGDYVRALADYDTAVRLEPDNDIALHNRGILHRELKNYSQALADLERSLALDRDDHSTMTAIGRTLADQGRHGDALAYYDRVIAERPKHESAWFRRGLSLGALGRHDEALRDLRQAKELGATDPELFAAIDSESRMVGLGMVLKAITPPSGGATSAPGRAGRPPVNPDFDMGDELDF